MTKTEFVLMGKRLAALQRAFGSRLEVFQYNVAVIQDFYKNPFIENEVRGFLLRCNEKYDVIRSSGFGYEVRVEGLISILDDMRRVYKERYNTSNTTDNERVLKTVFESSNCNHGPFTDGWSA